MFSSISLPLDCSTVTAESDKALAVTKNSKLWFLPQYKKKTIGYPLFKEIAIELTEYMKGPME